jgi:hypothetical protein
MTEQQQRRGGTINTRNNRGYRIVKKIVTRSIRRAKYGTFKSSFKWAMAYSVKYSAPGTLVQVADVGKIHMAYLMEAIAFTLDSTVKLPSQLMYTSSDTKDITEYTTPVLKDLIASVVGKPKSSSFMAIIEPHAFGTAELAKLLHFLLIKGELAKAGKVTPVTTPTPIVPSPPPVKKNKKAAAAGSSGSSNKTATAGSSTNSVLTKCRMPGGITKLVQIAVPTQKKRRVMEDDSDDESKDKKKSKIDYFAQNDLEVSEF